MKGFFPRLFSCALALACAAPPAPARQQQQQPASPQQSPAQPAPEAAAQLPGSDADEVLQVNTRVVFLDALVTDKKTRSLATDLKPENFSVLADGRTRELSYFSREGDAARRPLALALVFDLERLGAGRYMRRTEILEAMAGELAKLPPADEVAVVVLDPSGQDGRREWLTPFTRNRAQTASALAVVPTLVGEGAAPGDAGVEGGPKVAPTGDEAEAAKAREAARAKERENEEGVSVEVDGKSVTKVTLTAPSVEAMKAQLEDFDKGRGRHGGADEVDKIVDKKGRTLTRTLKPDGTLLIQRVNPKDGSVEVDVHDGTDLPRAVFEVSKRIARERPGSQGAVVYVTDGIALMAYAERDYLEHRMLRQNFIFSALVTDMKTGFKLARPLLSPLGGWMGLNIYGGAQHIAKQTGGEAVRVSRPSDYAAGLAKIVGNLNARYSLGFTLAEGETDDGRLHPLEVSARAKDAKGKDRKLEVKTRSGYFMPVTRPAPPLPDAAKKAAAEAEAGRVKN